MLPPPHILHQDLERSRQREHALQLQLQNLTSIVSTVEQREDLHLRQLDVLTERVMEVEAAAANERNQLLEAQANCTELAKLANLLGIEVEEWKTKCSEFVEKKLDDEKTIGDLGKKLRNMSLKAEDLAAMIERHRLDDGIGTYRQKTKKKKGFFAWLFGGSDNDIDLGEAFDTARSTLLEALQAERNSVEELELIVASFQQNNSAIAEQVKSRDLIISELNDRVAVFEEDKMVLKAALRQLQKEMNDEAPKTQKLVEDLEDAREEIDRLHAEIESLVKSHQDEIKALQNAISVKQETIKETESNLTVIGTYVDKLEERLADFAVTRRDIEAREQRCQNIEKAAKEAERQRDHFSARVTELEKEHNELKDLFEELIQARTKLQNEFSMLTRERNDLFVDRNQLQTNQKVLSEQLESIRQERSHWQSRSREIEMSLNTTLSSNRDLQEEIASLNAQKADLQGQLGDTSTMQQELKNLIQGMEASRTQLKERIFELEQMQQESSMNAPVPNEELEKKEKELIDLQAAIDELKGEHQQTVDSLLQETREKDAALQRAEQRAALLEEDLRTASAREIEIKQKVADREDELRKLSEQILSVSVQQTTKRDQVGDKFSSAPPSIGKMEQSHAGEADTSEKDVFFDVAQSYEPMEVLPSVEVNATKMEEPTLESKDPFAMFQSPPPPGALDKNATSPVGVKNATKLPRVPKPSFEKKETPKKDIGKRKVPFRRVRKFFAKTTGVHGLFTPPSHPHLVDSKKRPQAVVSSRIPKKVLPIRKDVRSQTKPSTAASTSTTSNPPAPPSGRPDVVKHTLGGIRLPQITPETKR